MIRNIDNCPYSEKDGEYGGQSCLKNGLIIDAENWLIKFPKNASYLARHEEMQYTNDTVSEYLGSHVYEILGYPVHQTELFERNNKIVVGCKDFLAPGERLVEIRTIKNSANNRMSEVLDRDFNSTGSSHIVNFEEILLHLKYNNLLNSVDGLVERFYDQIVIDALINNSDRNNGNWGIIRTTGSPDRLAPIYDNGGSFNGKTPDSRLQKQMEDKQVEANVLNGISAFGRETNFLTRDLLMFDIPELQQALIRNVPLIKEKMSEIKAMIDSVDSVACSDIRKNFYKQALDLRIECLLEPAYSKAIYQCKDYSITQAMERVWTTYFYDTPKEDRHGLPWDGQNIRPALFEDMYIAACEKIGVTPRREIRDHFWQNCVDIQEYEPRFCRNTNINRNFDD